MPHFHAGHTWLRVGALRESWSLFNFYSCSRCELVRPWPTCQANPFLLVVQYAYSRSVVSPSLLTFIAKVYHFSVLDFLSLSAIDGIGDKLCHGSPPSNSQILLVLQAHVGDLIAQHLVLFHHPRHLLVLDLPTFVLSFQILSKKQETVVLASFAFSFQTSNSP